MDFQNTNHTCIDCNKEFVWTAGEQEFMHDLKEKGKLDERQPDGSIKAGEVLPPKRCAECRRKRKAARGF